MESAIIMRSLRPRIEQAGGVVQQRFVKAANGQQPLQPPHLPSADKPQDGPQGCPHYGCCQFDPRRIPDRLIPSVSAERLVASLVRQQHSDIPLDHTTQLEHMHIVAKGEGLVVVGLRYT
jgi:hypothetical protein